MFGIRVIKVRPTDSVIHFNVVGLLRISQFALRFWDRIFPKSHIISLIYPAFSKLTPVFRSYSQPTHLVRCLISGYNNKIRSCLSGHL
jgi:hypothetical protein